VHLAPDQISLDLSFFQLERYYIFQLNIIKSDQWKPLLFESGKGSLIFKIVSLEKNVTNVSRQSLLSHFHNIPQDYYRFVLIKDCASTDDLC
jgi:hypothetical protein